jgi:hypothetical protein
VRGGWQSPAAGQAVQLAPSPLEVGSEVWDGDADGVRCAAVDAVGSFQLGYLHGAGLGGDEEAHALPGGDVVGVALQLQGLKEAGHGGQAGIGGGRGANRGYDHGEGKDAEHDGGGVVAQHG